MSTIPTACLAGHILAQKNLLGCQRQEGSGDQIDEYLLHASRSYFCQMYHTLTMAYSISKDYRQHHEQNSIDIEMPNLA